MIFFSILGKFGAVFASIPAPIFAALYCLFFAYVGMFLETSFLVWNREWVFLRFKWIIISGAGGLSLLQFCNLNSFRTKFILGFSVFMGLSIPQYFNEYTAINKYGPVHTKARWVNKKTNILLILWNPLAYDNAWLFSLLFFTVQWYDQCSILFWSICCRDVSILSWCNIVI